MKCSPELKLTSEELENAVAKLRVPLNWLHLDGMGGVVVGPERTVICRRERRILSDLISYRHDGCWLWKGCIGNMGYGHIRIMLHPFLAHRVVYTVFSEYPGKLNVLHECDNPPCVCPFHLFVGTQADNNRDCMLKGRANKARGEDAGKSKLTEADVRMIRLKASLGNITMREIARQHGASNTNISSVVRRLTWKHVV